MSFEVTYTIHASSKYKIPNSVRENSNLQGSSALQRNTLSRMGRGLFRYNASIPDFAEGSNTQEEKNRYKELKAYFEKKLQSLGITDPFIRYDDEGLKIELGYAPKEVEALFSDFIDGEIDPSYAKIFDLHFSVLSITSSANTDFNKRFIEPRYKEKLDVELDAILKEAGNAFQNSSPFVFKPIQTNVSEEKMIDSYLKDSPGLVLGEIHEHQAAKLFLIENLNHFKKQGVTTVFLEHLLYERHQKMIDAYVAAPQAAKMPVELEVYLKHLDRERELTGDGTFYNLVKSIKLAGLKIIAIDTQAVYHSNLLIPSSGFNNEELKTKRYLSMNLLAYQKIAAQNDGGKFVAFVGSGHVYRCKEVPGVSDLLKCPGLVVHDTRSDKEKSKINFDVDYPEEQVTLSTVYTRSKTHQLYDPISFEDAPPELSIRKF